MVRYNESRNYAVFDTGSTSSMRGSKRLKCVLDSLSVEELQKV